MINTKNKISIGITGQAGFIGTHIFNTLGLDIDKFERIPFKKKFFTNSLELERFVSNCDVIIHLAAMNRHNDPQLIYQTNIELVKKLISAMEKTNSKPHVLFSSSSQEETDNAYGKSKKEGRLLFEKWALDNNSKFTGLIIPNVFGPFGHPYYNSVVATFCHQLTHNEFPKIEVDSEIKLIYVAELVKEFIKEISSSKSTINHKKIDHTSTIRVSVLLNKLLEYKENYFEKGVIPDLKSSFEKNLFITFLCYIDHKTFFPFNLAKNTDARGSFVETIKLNSGGQVSFSTTVSGVTRGNHFHTRKAERFAVIKGKALIELRKIGTDEILSFKLDGNNPSFVDMPVWHTHNIKNIGEEELYTIFWINEFYDPKDPDTFFVTV
jgi:UDP-2-acetamido-2,6-beta-L-arabino-hexul-4-ose reductase